MQFLRIICLLTFSLGLSGCKEIVQAGLSESEANRYLAVLYKAGIASTKSTLDTKTYDVKVSSDDLNASLGALSCAGLPRQRTTKLPDYLKKEGLSASTPSEERIRITMIMGREIEQTIELIDGVLEARVHINAPAAEPLVEKPKTASASVFIKHRPDIEGQVWIPKIKQFVQTAIEGISYDKITVTTFAAELSNCNTQAASKPNVTTLGSMTTPLIVGAALLLLILVGNYFRKGIRAAIVRRQAGNAD